MQNTIMFIIMVWATFLARVKPVSTRAKPACMKKTRKPAISIHITLIAVARSSVVGPVLSAEAMPVNAHQQRQDQERKDQASSKRFTHGIRILL